MNKRDRKISYPKKEKEKLFVNGCFEKISKDEYVTAMEN